MNRVQALISNAERAIKSKLESGELTEERFVELSAQMNMEFDEYVMLQELKSLAVANQVLSVDEGMTAYAVLGETVIHFNSRPFHEKYAMAQLFKELLELNRV